MDNIKTIYQFQPIDNTNKIKLVEAGKTFDDITDIYQNEFEITEPYNGRCIIVSCLHDKQSITYNNKDKNIDRNIDMSKDFSLFKIIVENNDEEETKKIVLKVRIGLSDEIKIGCEYEGIYSIVLIQQDKMYLLENIDYTSFDDIMEKMIEYVF